MKNFSISITMLTAIIFGAIIPVTLSAHFVNPSSNYELVAAVGADGHDHEHAPVAPVVDGVGDGHTDHEHMAGAPDLLVPGSTRWFGLLVVSTLITSALSYGVYRYIQVAPVETKKLDVSAPEKK